MGSTTTPSPGDTATPTPGITAASFAGLGSRLVRDVATSARRQGFESFWVAETTGAEAFATLAAVGAEHPGLALGTGVIAVQIRTPMVAAMGAATLTELDPDRTVRLGVGVSSPVVVGRWHGAEYGTRPLAQMREYLTLVRACWSGEPVTFDGDYYHCSKFRLGVRLGDRRPELVLAALNPQMLRLAGELADGVLLNYLPASAVRWCIDQVRAGEVAAGRADGSCRIHAYVHVGVADRGDAAVPARQDLFSYAVVDSYAAAFERAGFAEEVEAVRAAHAAGDRAGALAGISDRMIDAIDIVGDAAHVRSAFDAYVAAGVDHPILMPLPWGPDRASVIRSTIEAVAPS